MPADPSDPETRRKLLAAALAGSADSPGWPDKSELQKALLRAQMRLQWREFLDSPEGKRQFVEAAINWVAEKWPVPRECPYCSNTEWEVGTPLEIQTAQDESLTPHFPVMCSNCGNTVFINAVRAGLVPEPDEEP